MILGTVLSHPTGFLSSIAAIWVIIVWLATYVSKKSQAEIRENYTDIESLKNTFKYIFAGYKIFVMLLFTPVLIGIFSVFVYPMVPRYLGGGEPTPVAIYFEKNSDVSYISSSTPYYGLLIYQSPDFVLTKDDKRVFLIKQENIAYQEYFSQKISIMATK